MSDDSADYLEYTPAMDAAPKGEAETIDKITAVLRFNNERAYRIYKRGVRDAHAKSHAVLRGELVVEPDLPPLLAQGMFATARSYPVIARMSSTSGAIRTDQTRGVRGLGIKVLGVEGDRALPEDIATTQDFIMVTHREFLFKDAKDYLNRGMPIAFGLARLSDPALRLGSWLLDGLNSNVLSKVGMNLPPSLMVFVRANTHILGETFHTSAPLRYGKHIVKMRYVPASPEVRALIDMPTDDHPGVNAFQEMVIDFFSQHEAVYELQAQFCTNEKDMPIEDATVEWKDTESPYRTVATIRYPVQDPYTPERRAYGDDVLSFNSWRSIDAHRPLGSINRLKLKVYEASSNFRHQVNNAPRVEPSEVSDLPV